MSFGAPPNHKTLKNNFLFQYYGVILYALKLSHTKRQTANFLGTPQNDRYKNKKMAAGVRQSPLRVTQPSIYAGEPRPRIPEETRFKIWADFREGMPVKDIAAKFNVSPHGVKYTVLRAPIKHTMQELPHTGGPHKISPAIAANLAYRVKNGTLPTVEACLAWLADAHQIIVCKRTLLATLKRHDIILYVKQAKPFVSEEQAEMRVKSRKRRLD